VTTNPAAGKPVDPSILLVTPPLITAYCELWPDLVDLRQRVVLATSGQRHPGTKEIYKIYTESFLGHNHVRQIKQEAQTIVSETLARSAQAA
jgi:hypothetical protein